MDAPQLLLPRRKIMYSTSCPKLLGIGYTLILLTH